MLRQPSSPTVLNDKPAWGHVKALTDLSDVHGGTITRSDVAEFVVQQLTTDTWLRKAPLITADRRIGTGYGHLATDDAELVIDETGFLKQGKAS
jgi:hypothetical protein